MQQSGSIALDINQLHLERSNRIEAAALAADAAAKSQHFTNLNTRVHEDVMQKQGAALLPLIIGPHGKVMAVFASASVCECEGCLSQEIHPTWSAAYEPYPPLVPGFPAPAAEIAAQAFAQAFMEELSWNQPADDRFAWNTAVVAGIQVWIPKSSSTHEISYSQDSHALQLHVDIERLMEAVSAVSLSSRSPHPYRSPPFFRYCPESSEHCNFVLPLTGWRLPHPSSNKRIACDPVVLDVRTVLILQDRRVQDYLHSASASIMSSHAFAKSTASSMSLIAAAACDGSNWSVCGSGCEKLVSQREAVCAGQVYPMFKLYVGCLSSAESFDFITHHDIKAVVNCCWKDHPVTHHATRGIRYCVVGSDNLVNESSEVAEQRDICRRDWRAVLELARECRSAGVAMLVFSCEGKSRSGSVASLCLSYLNFPGCTSILASHQVVGEVRACVQACNPAYLRWAQEMLDEQQHSDGFGHSPEIAQHSQERASLSWLLIDGKFGVPKNFKKAFEVALAGDRLNCLHCKGALARCYLAGLGVAKDAALGLHLAQVSAAAGSQYGHFVLGVAHVQGGNHQDFVQAVGHLRMAASRGLASAQHNLGTMYMNGQGLPQDHKEALKLFHIAASQEYSPAHFALGHAFENGLGVPVHLPNAVRWYQSACLHSDGEFHDDAVQSLERIRLKQAHQSS